jgi:Cu+-exporting ATPase
MVGTGVGAKNGILIKGGEPLETARRITKIVFDKTGTLTQGSMSVYATEVFPGSPLSKTALMSMVGLIESNSEHPIGKSIVEVAPPPYLDEISECTSVPGSGMRASVIQRISGKILKFTIGNLKFMQEHDCMARNVDIEALEKDHESQGRTVIFVAVDSVIVSIIALADTIKPEAPAVVRALQRMGIQVAMVTGDQELTARTIADICGIQEVHAGVSPSGKQAIVSEMQLNDVVAFVGDGVNDSASLAQSDMGIAVYGGTDVAVAAASVVLMRPDLRDVITAIDLSKTIFRRIWLNFVFASVYNVLMIPLAMGFGAPWGIFF